MSDPWTVPWADEPKPDDSPEAESPSWTPLRRRTAGLGPDDTFHDGIPVYLRGSLEDWVRDRFPDDGYERRMVENTLKFRLRLESIPVVADVDDDLLLELIDALLAWELHPQHWPVRELHELLTSGGAGWRLTAGSKGLERRIDETVTRTVDVAVRDARQDASEHLRTAWTATYGRHPDPDKAYDEAVLAVEALACPLVCPANPRRTLGTVIRDLRNQSDQWILAIGDQTGEPASPARLNEMLALLWEGQSRHAGSANSRRQTQTEAEAALHLAATVVQWLTSGVLRRR
ncbi:hypothetical protein ABZ738_32440 [Micromonospora sp. NPDC047793]|uniref:hypothetical protein n=1 Tax=Micromonospora sp. NPDC047793 TaxID=3154342 RepID=UPI0033F3D3D8